MWKSRRAPSNQDQAFRAILLVFLLHAVGSQAWSELSNKVFRAGAAAVDNDE